MYQQPTTVTTNSNFDSNFDSNFNISICGASLLVWSAYLLLLSPALVPRQNMNAVEMAASGSELSW